MEGIRTPTGSFGDCYATRYITILIPQAAGSSHPSVATPEFKSQQVDRRKTGFSVTQTTVLSSAPVFDIVSVSLLGIRLDAPPATLYYFVHATHDSPHCGSAGTRTTVAAETCSWAVDSDFLFAQKFQKRWMVRTGIAPVSTVLHAVALLLELPNRTVPAGFEPALFWLTTRRPLQAGPRDQ